jgi:Tetratricopeptide repeat
VLLYARADYAQAEPLYRLAMKIVEQSFGPDHPNVATCPNNLAALLQATKRFSDAEPLVRRALAIDEASFGPDHPDVAKGPQQTWPNCSRLPTGSRTPNR